MRRVMPGRVRVARSEPRPTKASGTSHLNASATQRPALRLLYAEPFRAAAELAWQRIGGSGLAAAVDAAPGDGHPVVIFPGLGGGAKSVSTLSAH